MSDGSPLPSSLFQHPPYRSLSQRSSPLPVDLSTFTIHTSEGYDSDVCSSYGHGRSLLALLHTPISRSSTPSIHIPRGPASIYPLLLASSPTTAITTATTATTATTTPSAQSPAATQRFQGMSPTQYGGGWSPSNPLGSCVGALKSPSPSPSSAAAASAAAAASVVVTPTHSRGTSAPNPKPMPRVAVAVTDAVPTGTPVSVAVPRHTFNDWKAGGFACLKGLRSLHRYTILAQVAESLYGMVVLASDSRRAGQLVTIKISSRALMAHHRSVHGGLVLEDLDNEARTLQHISTLTPPKELTYVPVLPLVETLTDSAFHYLVTQFLPGGDLGSMMTQRFLNVGVSEQAARKYMTQLIVALQWLHLNGIAHCDISLDNLCIDANDNLYLVDFGVCIRSVTPANPVNRQPPMVQGLVRGKFSYNSPELIQGLGWDTYANDVFHVGVLMFMLLTGSGPFFSATTTDQNFMKMQSGEWTSPVCRAQCTTYARLGATATDLIDQIIKPESMRITLAQVLRHPWFASTA